MEGCGCTRGGAASRGRGPFAPLRLRRSREQRGGAQGPPAAHPGLERPRHATGSEERGLEICRWLLHLSLANALLGKAKAKPKPRGGEVTELPFRCVGPWSPPVTGWCKVMQGPIVIRQLACCLAPPSSR